MLELAAAGTAADQNMSRIVFRSACMYCLLFVIHFDIKCTWFFIQNNSEFNIARKMDPPKCVSTLAKRYVWLAQLLIDVVVIVMIVTIVTQSSNKSMILFVKLRRLWIADSSILFYFIYWYLNQRRKKVHRKIVVLIGNSKDSVDDDLHSLSSASSFRN